MLKPYRQCKLCNKYIRIWSSVQYTKRCLTSDRSPGNKGEFNSSGSVLKILFEPPVLSVGFYYSFVLLVVNKLVLILHLLRTLFFM